MARFNIEAHLHRLVGRSDFRTVVWIRRYARIETAIRKATEFLIVEGEVGDLIEFVLRINGMQVGTVRRSATGKLEVLWNNSEAKKLRNASMTIRKGDAVYDRVAIKRSEVLSKEQTVH